MNRQAIGKLTEALYISILSELIEENKRYEEAYEEKFFSKEDLEKVASNRTLKIVLSQEVRL
tara:strand:+ start:417 stop:602 length:186 start_codon:yes stop_codon:yes gene_type:complete